MKTYTVELTRLCKNVQSRQIEVKADDVKHATAEAFAMLDEDDDFWDGVMEEPIDTERATITLIEEIK